MTTSMIRAMNVSRRELLRFGGCAFGSAFFAAPSLLADGGCQTIDSTITAPSKPEVIAGTLQYWIDGLHLGSRSNIKSRANIALFMNLKQTPQGYVESVAIIDDQQKVLGARYFDATTQMSTGHVPYSIFENVALDPVKKYTAIYRYVKGTQITLYSAEIDRPEISRLNSVFLPNAIKQDFSSFLLGNGANPTPGLVTTQFQFYTLNGLSAHTARGRMLSLGQDGSFTLNIDFMHDDFDVTHFMRYFMVLDPVGRILGVQKRNFGDAKSNGGKNLSWNVTQLTNGQISTYGLPPEQVPNILDCPYVQIYTEDSFDAMAKTTLRFR